MCRRFKSAPAHFIYPRCNCCRTVSFAANSQLFKQLSFPSLLYRPAHYQAMTSGLIQSKLLKSKKCRFLGACLGCIDRPMIRIRSECRRLILPRIFCHRTCEVAAFLSINKQDHPERHITSLPCFFPTPSGQLRLSSAYRWAS